MEPQQYEIMDRVEASHWWYLGLRDLLTRGWQQPELHLPAHPAVLDAGCGTGGNLQFFYEQLQPAYLGGFDNSPRALAAAARKCPAANIYASDICQPWLRRHQLDLIFCCDVVYVPGLAASRAGLTKLVKSLRSGGQFILHLPAYNWLKSYHDQAVHTRERYVLRQVKQLMNDLELDCVHASYRLCPLLPLVILRRLPRQLIRREPRDSHEMAMPSSWLNRWLLRVTQAENRLIARGRVMPWGSSIVSWGRSP